MYGVLSGAACLSLQASLLVFMHAGLLAPRHVCFFSSRSKKEENRRLHPWEEVWPAGMIAAGVLLFLCYATEECRYITDPGRYKDDKMNTRSQHSYYFLSGLLCCLETITVNSSF